MKLTQKIATLFCCLALFAACKKTENDNNNNNNNNNTLTKKQMLEAGKWQMTAATTAMNYMGMDTTIDAYAQMDACDKDDFVQFASDGTGSIDENTDKCTGDEQVDAFTWELTTSDTKLVITDDSSIDTMTVLEITASQIKLTIMEVDAGMTMTSTQTFKNIK